MNVLEMYQAVDKNAAMLIADHESGKMLRLSYDPLKDERLKRADLRTREIKNIYAIMDFCVRHRNDAAQAKIVCEI